MKTRIIFFVVLAMYASSCNRHDHSQKADNDHSHEEAAGLHEEHEEPKFQYTAYSNDFEVFAEADPFIVGEPSNVLAHFTHLPGFVPLDSGKITAVIKVNEREFTQTLESPTRKGIYSFDIQPETAGKGSLHFIIEQDNETYEVQVPEVVVFETHQEAHEAAEEVHMQNTNTAVFTKEQSWKIDFATEHPQEIPFGQVIKTAALVEPAVGSEAVVVAKAGGIVNITSDNLIEGMEVRAGEAIVTVSGSSLAENNLSVRYIEAKNNYEKAQAEYERMQALAEDRIVSQSQLLEARNEYENARAVFDNLKSNFTSAGQTVTSPMNGYVRQVFVENGMFVEAGQQVVTVAQNNSLMLTANVAQRYVPALNDIVAVNVHSLISDSIYTLEELNGKILSYGKAANTNNFMIPVTMEIDNKGTFLPGSFVEVYLKTLSEANALVVPNTSLLEEQGNYFVWVQVTPELFEKRLVDIGTTDGIQTQIKSRLSPDERIVSRGAIMIKLAQATGTLDAHSGHVH